MLILEAHPLLDRRSANSWNIEELSVSGGQTLARVEQVIASPVSPWRADIRLGLLRPAERRQLAAWLSRLRGRVHGVRLRPQCCPPAALFSRLGVPVPSAQARAQGVPHAGGAFFSSGVGYAITMPAMALALAAPAFARTAVINPGALTRGLLPHDYIGLGGRLHRLTAVYPEEAAYRVEFEPALRLGLPAGSPIDLFPSCTMHLRADDGGHIATDHVAPVPVTLSFVESPDIA